VVKTDQGYGLISGWRRLAALEALGNAEVDALIRTPKDAGEAYVAMVEENEIRAGLSYYERARIAAMAAARGAFEDTEGALSALYGNVSRAKRSKIRSFVSLFETLDDKLQFPDAIPERLGLKIAGALKEGKAALLKKALSSKAASPEAEMDKLTRALAGPVTKTEPLKEDLTPDIAMETRGTGKSRRVTLSGAGLTDEAIARLKAALKP
jgi:ParB-like chromosome segregation protein Spo0J